MVRIEPTADASFAAMRDRSRLGMAMAAMIKIIATTISNSISEKPFCFLFIVSPRRRDSEIRQVNSGGCTDIVSTTLAECDGWLSLTAREREGPSPLTR